MHYFDVGVWYAMFTWTDMQVASRFYDKGGEWYEHMKDTIILIYINMLHWVSMIITQ